ncbi:hypothetical protein JB92DRAFT_3124994 [Gautieria morchelliformis]|nr:hypothetical protein JB92DRAFT_3124994 [Gautieria morchelliformis]
MVVEHAPRAVVEYPASGVQHGAAVAHVFALPPGPWVHPKTNLKYSVGDSHSGHPDVKCYLLTDAAGETPVACYQTKLSCRSVKTCTYTSEHPSATTPTYDSTGPAYANTHKRDVSRDATREVFEKTLVLYTALLVRGCSFEEGRPQPAEGACTNADNPGLPPDAADWVALVAPNGQGLLLDTPAKEPAACGGHFSAVLPFWQGKSQPPPLVNLGGTAAAGEGYGPLAPCAFVAMHHEQKELCPYWHRTPQGKLEWGILSLLPDCPTCFEMYVPNDLTATPYIVLVSCHPHSHKDPSSTRTPLATLSRFKSMLRSLGWHLADATPSELSWIGAQDPVLSDLHPSLGNSDHVYRIIQDLHLEIYPDGTGFKGARLCQQHLELPPDQQYLRCVETVHLPDHDPFTIIICMFPAMSQLLLTT